MKKSIIYIIVLMLLCSMLGCQNSGSSGPDLLEPVGVKLDTAVAQRGDIYETTIYNGSVVPYVEELSFVVDGRLGEIGVKTGDTVRKGQVLATLDNEQTLKQIENLQEEISHAHTMGEYNDRLAQLDIEIAEEQLAKLRADGAPTNMCLEKELQIEQLELDLEQSQELRALELEYKEEQLAKLKKQISNGEIVAPFSGQVIYVLAAKEGSSIGAYKTVIGLADEDRLSVSTDYINATKIDDAQRVYARILDTDVQLTYVPMDSREYVSKVLAGETVKSEFIIETDLEKFESGQFAAVMLITSYKENVLTVPANAVYRDEKGRYVYKIQGDERIRCSITVGIANDVEVEIVEGLQEGDVVYVKE
ncbi:MAG: biotin/lipoyl-binding protein [Firmicutes bacterium]|nr:biotin/lipoyl-binding protein [Bacillota bacterium]